MDTEANDEGRGGTPITVPNWIIDLLRKRIPALYGNDSGLATKLTALQRMSHVTARGRVSRFLSGKAQSLETYELMRKAIPELPAWPVPPTFDEYIASSGRNAAEVVRTIKAMMPAGGSLADYEHAVDVAIRAVERHLGELADMRRLISDMAAPDRDPPDKPIHRKRVNRRKDVQ